MIAAAPHGQGAAASCVEGPRPSRRGLSTLITQRGSRSLAPARHDFTCPVPMTRASLSSLRRVAREKLGSVRRFRKSRHDGMPDIGDRAGQFAADQVHRAELIDARANLLDLPVGKDLAKQVAGIYQPDQGDIPGIGDVVGEQRVPNAQLDLAFNPAPDMGSACRLPSSRSRRRISSVKVSMAGSSTMMIENRHDQWKPCAGQSTAILQTRRLRAGNRSLVVLGRWNFPNLLSLAVLLQAGPLRLIPWSRFVSPLI